MANRQKFSTPSLVRRLSLLVPTLALLFLHCTVFADSLVPLRITDGIDQAKFSEIKDEKLTAVAKNKDDDLSAVAKMDEKGDIVFTCLNLSLPLAHNPFKNKPGVQKLMRHMRLQVNPNGLGVMINLAFLF